MIIEVTTENPDSAIRELLSYATFSERVNQVYNEYRSADNQHLFGFMEKEEMVGCIGIEIDQINCEIKHIAVSPQMRTKGIGSQMIDWVRENFSIQKITAETDNDALGFYRNYGFEMTSLGEKYPGVERFLCEYER